MRAIPCLMLLLAATACAQPFEARIADELVEAGLSQPIADCMAGRWVDRLNVVQLGKIQSAANDLKGDGRRLTVGRMIARVRQIDDPEVVEVVTASSLVCALSA